MQEQRAQKRLEQAEEAAQAAAKDSCIKRGITADDADRAIRSITAMKQGTNIYGLEARDQLKSVPSPIAAAADTLLWQGFASVGLPGLAINRLVAGTQFGLDTLEPLAAAKNLSAAHLRAEAPPM